MKLKMPRINNAVIAGYLTADPKVNYTSNNLMIVNVSVGVNRSYKNSSGEWINEVDFIECKSIGKVGEVITRDTAKGSPVIFEGTLRADVWKDKEGHTRKKTYIMIDRVHPLEKPEVSGGHQEETRSDNSQYSNDLADDDVPF